MKYQHLINCYTEGVKRHLSDFVSEDETKKECAKIFLIINIFFDNVISKRFMPNGLVELQNSFIENLHLILAEGDKNRSLAHQSRNPLATISAMLSFEINEEIQKSSIGFNNGGFDKFFKELFDLSKENDEERRRVADEIKNRLNEIFDKRPCGESLTELTLSVEHDLKELLEILASPIAKNSASKMRAIINTALCSISSIKRIIK